MSFQVNRVPVECQFTRCIYNSNGTCEYSGRLKIGRDGECETKQVRGGGIRLDNG